MNNVKYRISDTNPTVYKLTALYTDSRTKHTAKLAELKRVNVEGRCVDMAADMLHVQFGDRQTASSDCGNLQIRNLTAKSSASDAVNHAGSG